MTEFPEPTIVAQNLASCIANLVLQHEGSQDLIKPTETYQYNVYVK